MKINNIFLILILSVHFIFHSSFATDPPNDNAINRVTPFTDLGKNFINSYAGWNSLYHITAVGITYVSVKSGLDAEILKITSGIDHRSCL
jgi:hypothetical protein